MKEGERIFVRPVCDCREAFEAFMATHDKHLPGVPAFKFCPWCATPLRVDGELGIHPVEGRDTCKTTERTTP